MNPKIALKELEIVLPAYTPPNASYVPYVRSGDLIFLSGHLAQRDGHIWTGRLGQDLDTVEGALAARSVAIDLLTTVQAATGDLDKVAKILKLMVLVSSTQNYTEAHLVANGASQLLKSVFGDRGAHARSAFSVAQLPRGACVEIEMIIEVRPNL